MANSEYLSISSAETIHKAAELLFAGQLVAFPTETVYGLGADALNEQAVMRIYEVKGRPINHPLIVHISSINYLHHWAINIPDYAMNLAQTYWPGPLTLVLKRSQIAKNFVTGNQNSVGIRVPNNPIALELLRSFESLGGVGVAAPSANRFGQVSPTTSSDVKEEIGKYLTQNDRILDGGRSSVGIESTIIDARDFVPRILRPGAITEYMLKKDIPLDRDSLHESNLRVSGNLESHYAPKAKVIIDKIAKEGQALIAMSNIQTPPGVHRISAPKSMEEFAQILYSAMRLADNLGFKELVVQSPPQIGIGIALFDRLTKAAYQK